MKIDKNLIIASEDGDEISVVELLNKGANPNTMGPNSGALHCASFNGHHNIVKILLEKGANPNIADKQSFYPLHLATSKKHIEICKTLISHKSDVNVVTNSLGNILHIASAIDFYQILELPEIKLMDIEAKDHEGKTALNVAVSMGKLEMVKQLIMLGANVNTVDNNNVSPLRYALSYMHDVKLREWEMIGTSKGITVKYQIINGCFRYIKPYRDNADNLGRILSLKDQKKISSFEWGPKEHINYLNALEIIQLLILNKADVEIKVDNYDCVMEMACSIGEPILIELFFKNHAAFNVANDKKATPLHYLARSKRLDGLKCYYKLNKEANSNVLDINGWSPGHYLADIGGHPEMAKLLISNNLDLTIASSKEFGPFKKGIRAFEVAKHWNDDVMANLLAIESGKGRINKS